MLGMQTDGSVGGDVVVRAVSLSRDADSDIDALARAAKVSRDDLVRAAVMEGMERWRTSGGLSPDLARAALEQASDRLRAFRGG